MNPEAFRRASDLFAQVCDLPVYEQNARLDEACAGDDDLRALVTDLLQSDREAERRASEHARRTASSDVSAPSVPGYSIQEKLGEGGMGVVWRAIQERTRRVVALKILSPSVIGSDRSLARFEREVELAAMLEHPGIARVYDSGIAGGLHYYVMELVEGVELDQYLAGKGWNERDLVALFEKLCRAVEHAHRSGVIHRDLKPSNVLVRKDGQPVVVDFGLAKAFDASTDSSSDAVSISLDGHVIGTPRFMSPEQAAGGALGLDVRTDVYSLGVMLFRSLSGCFPHDHGGATLDVLRRIAGSEPIPLSAVCREVDADLEVLVAKALARDREDRYADVSELAADLRRWLEGEPLAARSPSTLYILRKRLRRHSVPIAIAGVVLLTLIAGVIFYVVSIGKSREDAERWAYGYRIQLAERAFAEKLPREARALLEKCPPQFRNWEWDFLWSQLDLDEPVATLPDALDADYSRDGELLVIGRGRTGRNFPDSEVVLSRTTDKSIAWRVPSASSVEAVRFSPDQREIWVGRRNVPLRRLDAATGETLGEEDFDFVREIVFSPDGRQVAMVLYREGLVLRDLANGEEKRIRDSGVGRVRVSYSADSRRLLWTYDHWEEATGFALVVDSSSGEVVDRWTRSPWFTSSAIHPDGDTAYLGAPDAIWIWDLENGAKERVPQGRNDVVLEASRSGDRLYTTELGGPLSVWRIGARADGGGSPSGRGMVSRELELLWSCMTSTRASTLEERPGGAEVFATGKDPIRYDVTSNPQRRTLERTESVQPGKQRPKLRFAPDGSHVALTCSLGVHLRSFPQNVLIGSIERAPSLARAIAWSRDGSMLASAWGLPFNATKGPFGSIRIDDLQRGALVAERDVKQRVLAVSFDPAGRHVAIFTGKITGWMPIELPGELSILALPDLEPVWSTTVDDERYVGITLEFSPDGSQLALETGEKLRIWDSNSHRLLFELGSKPAEDVTAFAYDASGQSLAVVIGREIVEIDAREFAQRRAVCTVDWAPEALAFSPDGTRLVAGGREQIALMATVTGERLLRLATDQELFSVEFSPDSEYIGTAGDAQAFRAWGRFGAGGRR